MKCIVYGCCNQDHEGEFVGSMCAPCYKMITEGKPEQPSNNFIHEMYCELNQREQHNGSMMNIKPWK